MNRRLASLAALAVLVSACASVSSAAADCERIAGVREGLCLTPVEERREAPVDAMPVVGEDRELSVDEWRGKVVVLNFWASWCGPCRVEQPDLNEAYQALPDDEVAFVGISIQDSEPNALAHIAEFDIPYPSLFDPGNDYAARFRGVGPRTIPSTILLDHDGRVAVRVLGVVGTSEVLGLASAIAAER